MTAAGERNEAARADQALAASSTMRGAFVNASDCEHEQTAIKPKSSYVVDRDAATTGGEYLLIIGPVTSKVRACSVTR